MVCNLDFRFSQKQNQIVYGEHSLTGQKISNGVLFELAHLFSRFYASYGSLQQTTKGNFTVAVWYWFGLCILMAKFKFYQILIIFGCHQKFSMAVRKQLLLQEKILPLQPTSFQLEVALGCRASAIIYRNTRVYGDYQLVIAINASTRQLTVQPIAT